MSVIAYYFGLPHGQIWPNLLASAICVGLVWWRARARMIAHHAEALAQAARHHAEHLRQAADHHEEMKAHITAAAVPRPASRRAKTLATDPPKKAGT